MKISYAITVCNELDEVKRLLDLLLESKREQDEIVVLVDEPKADQLLLIMLQNYETHHNNVCVIEDNFNDHFADWKNKLTAHCRGDYIFQIDADEFPHPYFIENLPSILEHNSAVELYAVPRINTVEGLTQEHIQKWGWKVDDNGWVNWPDFQTRIYKNNPDIKWKNKVHEVLDGHKEFAYLPMSEEYALFHPKSIKRQEKQNNYYNTL
jgi:glycosyltransferase involved in cell wall biosynthesis